MVKRINRSAWARAPRNAAIKGIGEMAQAAGKTGGGLSAGWPLRRMRSRCSM
jgi:hypothetical protein